MSKKKKAVCWGAIGTLWKAVIGVLLKLSGRSPAGHWWNLMGSHPLGCCWNFVGSHSLGYLCWEASCSAGRTAGTCRVSLKLIRGWAPLDRGCVGHQELQNREEKARRNQEETPLLPAVSLQLCLLGKHDIVLNGKRAIFAWTISSIAKQGNEGGGLELRGNKLITGRKYLVK